MKNQNTEIHGNPSGPVAPEPGASEQSPPCDSPSESSEKGTDRGVEQLAAVIDLKPYLAGFCDRVLYVSYEKALEKLGEETSRRLTHPHPRTNLGATETRVVEVLDRLEVLEILEANPLWADVPSIELLRNPHPDDFLIVLSSRCHREVLAR